jgi:hypothetical protein
VSELIDISEPLRSLCDTLGLTYENVGRLDIEPGLVRADVYLLNEQGAKYVDLEKNEAAMEKLAFKVKS